MDDRPDLYRVAGSVQDDSIVADSEPDRVLLAPQRLRVGARPERISREPRHGFKDSRLLGLGKVAQFLPSRARPYRWHQIFSLTEKPLSNAIFSDREGRRAKAFKDRREARFGRLGARHIGRGRRPAWPARPARFGVWPSGRPFPERRIPNARHEIYPRIPALPEAAPLGAQATPSRHPPPDRFGGPRRA